MLSLTADYMVLIYRGYNGIIFTPYIKPERPKPEAVDVMAFFKPSLMKSSVELKARGSTWTSCFLGGLN